MTVNKSVEENKNSLENLKTLSGGSNPDLAFYLLRDVKKARNILENYLRRVNEKIKSLAASANVIQKSEPINIEEDKQKTVIEVKDITPVVDKIVKPQNAFEQKPYAQKPYEQKQYEQKPYEQKPYEKRNFLPRADFVKRPDNTKVFGTDNKPQFDRRNNNFNNNGQRPPFKKPFENKEGFKPRVAGAMPRKNFAAPIVEKPVKEKERQFGNKKKTHEQPFEKKGLSLREKMRMGIIANSTDEEAVIYRRVKSKKNKEEQIQQPSNIIDKAVITTDNLTVKLLSESISRPVAEIIKKMFQLGIMATINSAIEFDVAELVASELGVTLEKKINESFEDKLKLEIGNNEEDDIKHLVKRAPIVTVMGHVDHGKTSLLDALRQTNVISGEAGGITQTIGAYTVNVKGERITFIDTPGHAAFAAMRERGANLTDIAILVVAADDGIMPQTLEAIKYIKSANVPMIVAINKIDKQNINIEKVKQQLADNGVLFDEWGGDTMMCEISAKNKINLDKLLEMIILQAEVLELKANPNRDAVGVIIEAKLDKGKGPVATVLVQNGTLKIADNIISGVSFGKIRAMFDENGKQLKKAGPSTPVSIIGFDEVPSAGDIIYAVDNKLSKSLIEERKNKIKTDMVAKGSPAKTMEELFKKDEDSKLKSLNVIIKADVQGSLEAIKTSLMEIQNDEVKLNIIAGGVGLINENDVILAKTSNATIINFNLKENAKVSALAGKDKIDILSFNIIYNVIDAITDKLKSLQTPKYKENIIGHAEIRAKFKLSSVGEIAGCYVLDGKIQRNAKARVLHNGKIIAETTIDSVKIKKDDVKEAGVTFECGLKFANQVQYEVGDTVEAYLLEEIKF